MNQIPKRKSPRANFHNYSKGIFFVTVCTKDKHHFFGKIVNGNMIYTQIGSYTLTQIKEIPQHYPYAEVFDMVVMPNHVHFMIEIFDKDKLAYEEPRTHEPCDKQTNENIRTHEPCDKQTNGNIRTHEPCDEQSNGNIRTHEPCDEQSNGNIRTHEPCDEQSNGNIRTHEPCVPTERTALSVVIGGFKRAVTMFARRNEINFAWQSRYHDHIVRGINDFNKIGEYIRNNIGKWEEDCFYQI